MGNNRYKTAAAFRQALENRLQVMAEQLNLELQRLRRRAAFNRFLARMFASAGGGWVLKGGYSMELRLANARSTKDIDLSFAGKSVDMGTRPERFILELLQKSAAMDLDDYFDFQIGKTQMQLEGPLYGGARYPVKAMLDGRLFVSFHVDVALGDYIPAEVEVSEEPDWFAFAGVAAAKFNMLPRAVQFAEKLHSYSLPRAVPNSRIRDLVDLVLLIKEGKLDKHTLKKTLSAVFTRRKTHGLPAKLDPPPEEWVKPFRRMADECGLEGDISAAVEILNRFYSGV